MNVRKASIKKGLIYGVGSYAAMFFVFMLLLGIDASGIISTAALAVGCTAAYMHLKKSETANTSKEQ